jgi:hypothetical protein
MHGNENILIMIITIVKIIIIVPIRWRSQEGHWADRLRLRPRTRANACAQAAALLTHTCILKPRSFEPPLTTDESFDSDMLIGWGGALPSKPPETLTACRTAFSVATVGSYGWPECRKPKIPPEKGVLSCPKVDSKLLTGQSVSRLHLFQPPTADQMSDSNCQI